MLPFVFPQGDGFDQYPRFQQHVERDVGQFERLINPFSMDTAQQYRDVGVAVGKKRRARLPKRIAATRSY